MQLVLGIDSSTQSTKVEARDLVTGTIVGHGSARHPATTPPFSEQDPDSWFVALTVALEQLGDIRADVAAVAVAGQQHGLVLLDEAGQSVRPAQLWNDTRGAANASSLVDQVGAVVWLRGCGSVPVASFTIAKLAWMSEHEPHMLERVAQVMLPHDYLTWRLTGNHVTDRGDASGTGWFDSTTDSYRPELLSLAVDKPSDWLHRLPTVLPHTTPSGTLTAASAKALGLPAGIPVAPGTGDNMAGAIGLGLNHGDVAISLGTSGTVYAVSDQPSADSTGFVAGFAGGAGGFLPLVCTLNATKVTDTVARWLGTDAPGLSALAIDAGTNPGGPTLVPYFDGERTPNLPDATGVFAGLTNATTREQLARAAHDGVLAGLLDGLEALKVAGVSCDGTVNLIGGGARSAAYQQRCAELLNQTIVVPSADETVATGAAVLAAAILDGITIGELSRAWGLGDGKRVTPR